MSPRALYDVDHYGIDRTRSVDWPPGGERMNQDDYIIRIYRRDPQDSRMVVGTVEQVGEKLTRGFTDFEELRLILGVPRGRTRRDGGPPPEGTG